MPRRIEFVSFNRKIYCALNSIYRYFGCKSKLPTDDFLIKNDCIYTKAYGWIGLKEAVVNHFALIKKRDGDKFALFEKSNVYLEMFQIFEMTWWYVGVKYKGHPLFLMHKTPEKIFTLAERGMKKLSCEIDPESRVERMIADVSVDIPQVPQEPQDFQVPQEPQAFQVPQEPQAFQVPQEPQDFQVPRESQAFQEPDPFVTSIEQQFTTLNAQLLELVHETFHDCDNNMRDLEDAEQSGLKLEADPLEFREYVNEKIGAFHKCVVQEIRINRSLQQHLRVQMKR